MSAVTSIEWTERTWNPVRGCSIVSPGCVNCYAMRQAHRFSGKGQPYEGLTKHTVAGPQWTGDVRTVDELLLEPLNWRKPARVFVNSMSDLFHEQVPDEFIDRVFAVMALAPQHTFQVLTKRADRMREYISTTRNLWNGFPDLVGPTISSHDQVEASCREQGIRRDERERRLGIIQDGGGFEYGKHRGWPLPNVWLGVSCENQQTADERIPLLLQTPAAIRWVSAEPLLGPLSLDRMPYKLFVKPGHTIHGADDLFGNALKPLTGHPLMPGLDWVVIGGESGAGARPFDLAWARSILQQCQAAGVACFVKQLGARPFDSALTEPPDYDRYAVEAVSGRVVPRLLDRKGGDPSEWPEDLRVREYPLAEVPA